MSSHLKQTFLICMILGFIFIPTLSAQETINPKKYYLNNGLEVILVEMHKSPIIIQQLFYRVGSRNEQVGKTGISHVVEHMMFKGTKKYPTGKISQLIKRNSGVFNAYTTNDMTVYFEQLPRNKIDIALEIESDRMMNSVFDPQEFDREIQVIKEERRLRVENIPQNIFNEELQATFYLSHPYQWPVIGWMNDLNSITREDAYTYYKTFYTPNNAMLVLVGDFKSEEMLAKVKKYFGKVPRGPEVPKLNIQEPPIRTHKVITKSSPSIINTTYVAYFQGVNFASQDYPALTIAAGILSRGQTSRLYQKLVKPKLCRMAKLSVTRNLDMSPITFTAELYPETSLDTVKKIFRQEIELMKTQEVSQRELRKIKNSYKVSEAYDNMKVSEVASRLGNYELKAGKYAYYQELRDAISRVTSQDVQRVMNAYLNFDFFVEGILSPGDSIQEPISVLSKMQTDESPLEHEIKNESSAESLMEFNPNNFIRPNPIAPVLTEFKLKNGIPVIFYEDHTFPIVELAGVIQIGNAQIPEDKNGVEQFTSSLLSKGSKKYPYPILIDTLAMLSTGVNFSGSEEVVLFSWGTIKENFDAIMDIGSDLLQNPLFPEEELELIRKQRIAVLQEANKKTGWNTSRYLVEKIFRDHPYFQPLTVEALTRITQDDLKKFYQLHYQPSLSTLLVLGDIKQPELENILNRFLGNWENKTNYTPAPFPEQKPITDLELMVYTNYEDKQLEVRIAHEAPSIHHPDYEKLEMANYILGGSSLTSRLGYNIREKQGLTYGISSQLKGRIHGGWWFLESKTAPENVARLLISAIYEIERMQRELVTENELNDAKRFFLGIQPMVVEDPISIFKLLIETVKNNKPLNDFDTYPDRLIKITREDIQEVSKKYFHPERSVITVGGPITPEELKSAIDEQLTKTTFKISTDLKNIKIGSIN